MVAATRPVTTSRQADTPTARGRTTPMPPIVTDSSAQGARYRWIEGPTSSTSSSWLAATTAGKSTM